MSYSDSRFDLRINRFASALGVADDLRIDEGFDPYHFCLAICIMQLEISLILRASR